MNNAVVTRCPHNKRKYQCQYCSPSTYNAHKNRMSNRILLLKYLPENEYLLIEKIFISVLIKNNLFYLRKKYIPMDIWNIIEKELFDRLKEELPNYKEIKTGKNPIGCDKRFFRFNIERQLKKGMELEVNRKGIWDLDHIVPCASFDLTKLKDRKICFNFKNFEPLWTKKNQQKGGR